MTTDQTLNEDQQASLESILEWAAKPYDEVEPFYVLSGSAGTGKTYTIRALPNHFKGRIVYTAPTNKATKELRKSVTTEDYKPETCTIYSLLGLSLEASGEVKELKYPEEGVPDLSAFRLVVVDEGGMVNENLRKFIKTCSAEHKIKFLFMGDQAQLPPIGEIKSPIWKIKEGSALTKVMRHDNQILALATTLRGLVDHPAPNFKLDSNNDGEEGVWKLTEGAFEAKILEAAELGWFSEPDKAKAIAWRNVTVDKLNKLIRGKIFNNPTELWLPTDRVLFAAPAYDLEDQKVASTDDEGVINRIAVEWHPIYGEMKIFRISITLDDGRPAVARVLHPDSVMAFSQKLDALSDKARANRRFWKEFWSFKDAFHNLRYSYALTAHRAQGSTYETVFVDYRDILLNRTKSEAMRCLYVACTRPKKRLYLG